MILVVMFLSLKSIYTSWFTAETVVLKKSQRYRSMHIYDKKYACPFCEKLVCKFAEHILIHASEPAVVRMTTLTKQGSAERKAAISDLRKRGAFLNNVKVMRKGHGQFLVQRQSTSKNLTPHDFRCCPKCLGYYRKSVITTHFKSCAEDDPTRYVKEFNFALLSPNIDETLRPVTSLMKDDEITHVAINDSLITEYGKKLYSKLMTKGTVTKTENYVSTKMRELSRLLIEVAS